MPFVIKVIGADGFGVVSVAQMVMIYLATIADYGFNLTATRDVALFKMDGVKLSKIFFVTLVTKLLITFFLFILLILLIFFVPIFHEHFTLYLLGFVYVVGQSLLVSWFFQGMEKMQYITAITLFARIIFVALVFIFIRQKNDYVYFLFFLGLGNILAGVLSIYLAIRIFKLKQVRVRRSDVKNELKEGWQITTSNLSINTYLYTNIFILRLFTNDLVVGYYSIAEKIFFAVRQVLGIFSQVIYPRICQLTDTAKKELPHFFRSVYLPFLFLIFGSCAVLFLFSPSIVGLFLPHPPKLAVLLLQMLSFVPLIVCLNIPAYQLLLAFNKKKAYSVVLGLGTIVNIIANISLCPQWGATGTVISIILTELFITIGLNQQVFKSKLFYLIRAR